MSYLPFHPGMASIDPTQKVAAFSAITVLFAALGKAVRGVTTGGALAGGTICFLLLWASGPAGFAGLLTVFVLTWIATRIDYARKQKLGVAEARSGRTALQVLANLGTSAGCAVLYATFWPDRRILIAMAAALAEAAADTVSSEMGQALGGTPRLITSWRQAEPGTNGAITLTGSLDGTAAACAVGAIFVVTHLFGWRAAAVCVVAGAFGMIFDSLLGATVERQGWLGNNAVNFASTVAAAGLAFLIT